MKTTQVRIVEKKTRAGKDATDVVQTSEIAENGAFAEALLAFRTNG